MTEADRVHSTPPTNASVPNPTGIGPAAPADSTDSFPARPATRQPETAERTSESRKPFGGLSRRGMIAGLAVLPAAAAIPTAAPALPAATDIDPIFAAIERHRDLSARYAAAASVSTGLPAGPEFNRAEAVTAERAQLLIDHADELICSKPATSAGVVALMRYVASLEEWEEPIDWQEWENSNGATVNWHQTFLGTMAAALEQIGSAT